MIDEIIQKVIHHPKEVGLILLAVGFILVVVSDWDKHDDNDSGMFI